MYFGGEVAGKILLILFDELNGTELVNNVPDLTRINVDQTKPKQA